jgi:hypothetical protein
MNNWQNVPGASLCRWRKEIEVKIAVKGMLRVASANNPPTRAIGVALLWLSLLSAAQLVCPSGLRAQATNAPARREAPTLLTQSPPADSLLGPVDWLLLIDTSASMSGRERGAQDIFPRVQETLRRLVPEIREDDTLTIIVFDEASRIASAEIPKQLRTNSDRKSVVDLIDKLNAKGPWTQTGAALTDALNEVYARPDKGRPAAIILFTDGKEDVRGIQNPIRIPAAIRIIRDQDVPYVFYVSLGTHPEPDVMAFTDEINKREPGHARVIDDPAARDLPGKMLEIRGIIHQLRIRPLQIKPTALNLGSVRPGTSIRSVPLEFLSPVPATIHLQLLGVPALFGASGLPATLEVGPSKWQSVRLDVTVADDSDDGKQTFELQVEPELTRGLDPTPRVIPITLVVHQTIIGFGARFASGIFAWLLRYWWILLQAILLALLIAYLFRRWYIYGETPWDVLRSLFSGRQPFRRATLRTPDGPISFDRSVRLGSGQIFLGKSPAIIAINRVGNDYYLKVEKDQVEVVDPSGQLRTPVTTGGEEMKLRNKTEIFMPEYASAVTYINTRSGGRGR